MNLTRREALLMGSCAVILPLSGCQTLARSSSQKVDISLFNYTTDSQPARVEILRTDKAEHSDALVFSEEFEVPAPTEGESAGTLRVSDIVERRPYLLRVLPKFGNGTWFHHHYYPGESTTEESNAHFDIRIDRDETTSNLYIRFP